MARSDTHKRSRSLVRRLARRVLRWRYRNFKPEGHPARTVHVAGFNLRVESDVFDPALHFTSGTFARYLRRRGGVPRGSSVLDLGTGSGLLALVAAQAGAKRVVAVDINPSAVNCARRNVESCQMRNVIEVREGDGFEPVAGERFDLVVCNPPYFRGTARSMAERAFRGGPDLDWFVKFGSELEGHLRTGGQAIISLGDAAEIDWILEILRKCGWLSTQIARHDILVEVIYLFQLTRAEDMDNG